MTKLRQLTAALLAALAVGWISLTFADEPKSGPAVQAAAASTASAAAEVPAVRFDASASDVDAAVEALLAEMTLAEKIGQMSQVPSEGDELTPNLRERIRSGEIGSLINVPSAAYAKEAQHVAREQARLGIPLLVGRDVIHGYRTIFPIPLGQAASWNPELIEAAATAAAEEARSQGINWTFAPMVDICRDPRWGRIAETLGEDPYLASALAAALVRGFQQEKDGRVHGLVACAKHFAGYGLSEGGRDYNRASVSEADLHNVYLAPFHAAADAGCRTLMTTFSEVNGIPGTAHRYLLTDVLRGKWKFPGFVVSDWNSVFEMIEHGYSADETAAAGQAVNAGVDMEMAGPTFHDHLPELVKSGTVSEEAINDAVRRILRTKFQLASFQPSDQSLRSRHAFLRPRSLNIARRLARESLVLLKNDGVLPLDADSTRRIAVIGALADDPASQLGCWVFDGDPDEAITPLEALRDALGDAVEVRYAKGACGDFSPDRSDFEKAAQVAADADVVVLFVGETALLSGESRSRADLDLPGVQRELVRNIAAAGKPLVMVVLAGRPLTISAECEAANAVLYAWHPGTMGGPAIADILLGAASPAGKLPVTLPKTVGQVPLYYSHTNTGRPSPNGYKPIAETLARDVPQEFQYRSHYLDADPLPLFPFGHGLSYGEFSYSEFELSNAAIKPDQPIRVEARVTNSGDRPGTEVVQLYIRDLISQPVRPVRELKAFRRIHLRPGESKTVKFTLNAPDLAYLNAQGEAVLDPGRFAVWIGGDSSAELGGEFELLRTDADHHDAPSIARSEAGRTTTGKSESSTSEQN
jgi:beta-glucosidase